MARGAGIMADVDFSTWEAFLLAVEAQPVAITNKMVIRISVIALKRFPIFASIV